MGDFSSEMALKHPYLQYVQREIDGLSRVSPATPTSEHRAVQKDRNQERKWYHNHTCPLNENYPTWEVENYQLYWVSHQHMVDFPSNQVS